MPSMLLADGTMEALPTARSSFDLARKANSTHAISVAPVPPIVTTKNCMPRLSAWLACCPAW